VLMSRLGVRRATDMFCDRQEDEHGRNDPDIDCNAPEERRDWSEVGEFPTKVIVNLHQWKKECDDGENDRGEHRVDIKDEQAKIADIVEPSHFVTCVLVAATVNR
jgi:hypothetical protein